MCFYVVTFHFYVKIHEKVKHFKENVLHSSIEVCTSDISDFTLSLKWGEKNQMGSNVFWLHSMLRHRAIQTWCPLFTKVCCCDENLCKVTKSDQKHVLVNFKKFTEGDI